MRSLHHELVLFQKSRNCFRYVPDNKIEEDIFGWTTSNTKRGKFEYLWCSKDLTTFGYSQISIFFYLTNWYYSKKVGIVFAMYQIIRLKEKSLAGTSPIPKEVILKIYNAPKNWKLLGTPRYPNFRTIKRQHEGFPFRKRCARLHLAMCEKNMP